MIAVIVLMGILLAGVYSAPQQPIYSNEEYYAPEKNTQSFQNQPQYISVPPIPQAPISVYEGAPQHQVPQQFISNPPTVRVAQLLLPSAADRQIQKAAEQIAGPEYAQQIQLVQRQGLANEAVAVLQRRAQAQIRRAQQQQQQLNSAQQQEYFPREKHIQIQIPQQQVQQQY